MRGGERRAGGGVPEATVSTLAPTAADATDPVRAAVRFGGQDLGPGDQTLLLTIHVLCDLGARVCLGSPT